MCVCFVFFPWFLPGFSFFCYSRVLVSFFQKCCLAFFHCFFLLEVDDILVFKRFLLFVLGSIFLGFFLWFHVYHHLCLKHVVFINMFRMVFNQHFYLLPLMQ